jgi:hypothetical protein
MRNVDYRNFAPVARDRFTRLASDLLQTSRFRLFEGWRSPVDQEAAFSRGASKAHAFESPHQFGLAADFVPWDGTRFIWPDVSDSEWLVLGRLAVRHGLSVPIAWDKPHVEHPAWPRIRTIIRPASPALKART